MRIDSHQHFWKYSAAEYPWISNAMSRLRRDFLPVDLQNELKKNRLDGSIVVQARQTIEETKWLLALSEQFPFIKGVVGWADVRADNIEDQLAELAEHPKFVGVRHVLQDEADDRFMLRPDFMRGIEKLGRFGLTYDLLLFPRHLSNATKLVRKFPDQKFVLDHISKPSIKDGTLEPWTREIKNFSKSPNVYCKLSGMVTEARWTQWREADFRPYVDVVFEAFGEDRLMFGSDWPVCLVSASYQQVIGIVQHYFSKRSAGMHAKIFGGNAVAFYGL